MRNSTLKQTGERKALRKVVERDLFVPTLIGLEEWATFGTRDFPGMVDDAKQALLRLKLRRDHGCGQKGQIVAFDRHGAGHAATGGVEN